jgi:hypothetical protein
MSTLATSIEEDTGLELTEHRALVADYQKRFGVASEV